MKISRVLVTGGEGYLGRQYIEKLAKQPEVELIVSIDPRNRELGKSKSRSAKKKLFMASGKPLDYWSEGKVVHLDFSIMNPDLDSIITYYQTNIVAHFAWWFNPTHYLEKQRQLDIEGTKNVLKSCEKSLIVDQIIYTGSSTAYGQVPENDHSLEEKEWCHGAYLRLSSDYIYSRDKAEGDLLLQEFADRHSGIACGWPRAAIVLGPHTPNNVVAYVARSPFTFGKLMCRVKGFDPPMQFLSEYDMIEILYRATVEKWTGPFNAAGEGTIPYSEVIKTLGRKEVELPEVFLRGLCWLGWNLRIGDRSFLKFPPGLLKLVQYPWVGDITLLKTKYGYTPRYSSKEALLQFKEAFL